MVVVGVPATAAAVLAGWRDVHPGGVWHVEQLQLLGPLAQHVLDPHVVRLGQGHVPGGGR